MQFTLREKCTYSYFFWSVFSGIQTESNERKQDQKNSNNGHFNYSFTCFKGPLLGLRQFTTTDKSAAQLQRLKASSFPFLCHLKGKSSSSYDESKIKEVFMNSKICYWRYIREGISEVSPISFLLNIFTINLLFVGSVFMLIE